jgi:pimeloyl-ACP methyl ester carboxylesterase
MVTSPNSYWLSFFLKRGINVMCWNYRDYGLSQNKVFGSINPYNCKLDAEKVLDFVVNKMKLKGKIGVYGRSLGGIASTHLANKYPQYVKALIADRTFCELDLLAERRVLGRCTKFLFKLISFNWRALNDRNFIEAKCYKIVTCDPQDDVVENMSSLNVGIAMKYAVNQYREDKWRKFFDNLWLLYQLEDVLFGKLKEVEKDDLPNKVNRSTGGTANMLLSTNAAVAEEQSCTINEQRETGSRETMRLLSKEFAEGVVSPRYSHKLRRTEFSQAFILSKTTRELKESAQLHEIMYEAILALSDFQAGSISLRELVNAQKGRCFGDFQIFLKVLEVYGCGHNDDIDKVKYNNRQHITHEQQTIEEL